MKYDGPYYIEEDGGFLWLCKRGERLWKVHRRQATQIRNDCDRLNKEWADWQSEIDRQRGLCDTRELVWRRFAENIARSGLLKGAGSSYAETLIGHADYMLDAWDKRFGGRDG